jgi:hypothetical protein
LLNLNILRYLRSKFASPGRADFLYFFAKR